MEKNAINPSELHRISVNILPNHILFQPFASKASKHHTFYPSWNELLKIPLFIPETNTISCFPNDTTLAWKTFEFQDNHSFAEKWLLAWRLSFKFNKFQPDSAAWRHTKIGANLFTKFPLSTMHSLYSGDDPLSFFPWLWSGFYFLTTSQVRTLAFFGSNEFHTKLLKWK